MLKKIITTCLVLSIALFACQKTEVKQNNSDLLAEAFGEKLYLTDLNDLLKSASNSSDSQFVITRYVDNWTMDKILYQEAQKNIKNSNRLNQKVEDYKKSLYIYEYENLLLDIHLNTSIGQAEIDSFYKKHSSDFILKEAITKVIYIKVPLAMDTDTLKEYWKTEDLPALNSIAKNNQVVAILDIESWHSHSKLKGLMPEQLFRKINFKKTESYSLKDDKSKYYVKILENIKSKDQAPVNYMDQEIRDRILHNRSQKILKEKRQSIYQDNINKKNITIQN